MSANERVRIMGEQIRKIVQEEGRFVADPNGTLKERNGAQLWDALQAAIDELDD